MKLSEALAILTGTHTSQGDWDEAARVALGNLDKIQISLQAMGATEEFARQWTAQLSAILTSSR